MSQREAAIQIRLAKARQLLQQIPVLYEHQFYGTIISRLYYACFNATKALLLTKDIITKTHRGVAGQLHEHFVKAGTFDPGRAAFLNRLMQKREQEDYGEDDIFDPQTISELIRMAFAYVAYIETLVPAPEA